MTVPPPTGLRFGFSSLGCVSLSPAGLRALAVKHRSRFVEIRGLGGSMDPVALLAKEPGGGAGMRDFSSNQTCGLSSSAPPSSWSTRRSRPGPRSPEKRRPPRRWVSVGCGFSAAANGATRSRPHSPRVVRTVARGTRLARRSAHGNARRFQRHRADSRVLRPNQRSYALAMGHPPHLESVRRTACPDLGRPPRPRAPCPPQRQRFPAFRSFGLHLRAVASCARAVGRSVA